MIFRPRHKYYFLTIMSILLIPLVAMRFSNEIKWTIFDFFIAFLLLGTSFLGVEFILFYSTNSIVKKILIALLFFLLLTIWIELAVGIF